MKLMSFLWFSLYRFILSAHGAVLFQRVRPNGMAILPCGNLKNGTVTWSRTIYGHQKDILTTYNGEITRHITNDSYSSLPDLSLIIWFVSAWDNGLYYCNGTAVACLTVKHADGQTQSIEDLSKCPSGSSGYVQVNVMERVLMFSGFGLAFLMFVLATIAAIITKQSSRTTNIQTRVQSTEFELQRGCKQ